MKNNILFYNASFWIHLSKFCDIPELITLKYVNKSSNRVKISFETIVDRIKKNSFNTIPICLANRLYTYFLRNREYEYVIRVAPYTERVVSYRIFINLDIKMSEKLIGMIRRNPGILYECPKKTVWYCPYYIAKQTFGVNLEVFKYAIDLCIVYGLSFLINSDDFCIDTQEDAIFVEYIENLLQ